MRYMVEIGKLSYNLLCKHNLVSLKKQQKHLQDCKLIPSGSVSSKSLEFNNTWTEDI